MQEARYNILACEEELAVVAVPAQHQSNGLVVCHHGAILLFLFFVFVFCFFPFHHILFALVLYKYAHTPLMRIGIINGILLHKT